MSWILLPRTSIFFLTLLLFGCGASQTIGPKKPQRADFCDMQHVHTVVDAKTPELRNCYDQALAKNPNLTAGKWVVRWVIMPNGRTLSRRTKVHAAPVQNSGLESCLVEAVNGFIFNRPRSAPGRPVMCGIRMPFVFDHQGTPVLDAVKRPR